MRHGDTIKGKCAYCECVNLAFLGEEKETYKVGSTKEEYLMVMCLGCHTTQWIKAD